MVAVQVVEVAAPLDRDAQAAEAVVADRRRYPARHLLLVVAEEGVGRGRSAGLLDARPAHVVPVLLQQVAVAVPRLRQPVLGVPDKRLLADESLVAHGHVAVGVVVEAVGAPDSIDRVKGAAVAVAVGLAVEGGQTAGAVVAVTPAVGAGQSPLPVVREAVAGCAFG